MLESKDTTDNQPRATDYPIYVVSPVKQDPDQPLAANVHAASPREALERARREGMQGSSGETERCPKGRLDVRLAPAGAKLPAPGQAPWLGGELVLSETSDRACAIDSQAALARQFRLEHGHRYAWRPGLGWMAWGRQGWRHDDCNAITADIAAMGHERWVSLPDDPAKPSKRLPALGGSASTAVGTARLLQSGLARRTWDQGPEVVGLPRRRMLDLRTGKVRDQLPRDFITRAVGAAPAGDWEDSEWADFLLQAVPTEALLWLQRVCGYALTGYTREHLLLFIHGVGGTGKSVFLETLAKAFGSYAHNFQSQRLCRSVVEAHLSWLTDFDGPRLACTHEVKRGASWDTARINGLVSGEPVTANRMAQNAYTFTPQAQLIIAANNAPRLEARSTGLERRMRVLRFTHKPKTPDRDLPSRLQARLGPVVAWVIEGARAYLEDGLGDLPACVKGSTEEHNESVDRLADFVAEIERDTEHARADLKTRYLDWCTEEGYTKPKDWPFVFTHLQEEYGMVALKTRKRVDGYEHAQRMAILPSES